MPILNIEGRKVKVDDAFLQLSPEQQNATVEEIARSLGVNGAQTPKEPQAQPDEASATQEPETANSDSISAPNNALHSATMGAQAGAMFNFDDEIGAVLMTPIEMGIDAFQGKGFDPGRSYNQALEKNRGLQKQAQADNPIAYGVGEVAGGIASAGGAGGQLVKGATLGKRALQGAGVAAAQGAVHGAGAGETLEERGQNAVVGGGVGGVIGAAAPYVGNKIADAVRSRAQNKLINQVAKNAPNAKELKNVAASMFDQADNANIGLKSGAVQRLMTNIERRLSKVRPNEVLDQEAVGALKMFQQVVDDAARPGGNVVPDLKDLHIMRQAVGELAGSSKKRTSMIGMNMLDELDDFVKTLKPADVAGGRDPKAAADALMEGISTWSRASKAQVVENAIEAAKLQASGFENGLRIQFRQILKNPRLSRGFSEAEKDALKQVVNGTTISNIAKLLGKMGFDKNNGLLPLLAVGGGSTMGPAGAIAPAVVGGVARKTSEKLTEKSANRALGAISQGNALSLPLIDQSKQTLVESLTRGAAPALGQ